VPLARSKIRLSSISLVRSEVVRIYREGYNGERPIEDCARLASILKLLVSILETSDLEQRMSVIEARLDGRDPPSRPAGLRVLS
jgi:hypothetical protein